MELLIAYMPFMIMLGASIGLLLNSEVIQIYILFVATAILDSRLLFCFSIDFSFLYYFDVAVLLLG